ncbi:MAG TPA: hypothetical protein VF300_03875, partial [Methanothrix sp.]
PDRAWFSIEINTFCETIFPKIRVQAPLETYFWEYRTISQSIPFSANEEDQCAQFRIYQPDRASDVKPYQ